MAASTKASMSTAKRKATANLYGLTVLYTKESLNKNNIDGKGKMRWTNGRIYEGEWRENKMDGDGLFLWEDGREYEGQYKNDRKHGFGKVG